MNNDETRSVLMRVADATIRMRDLRGMTTNQLAKMASVDARELSLFLRGEADVRLHVIYQLAGALEIDPAELLAGIEWVPDGAGGGEYRVDDPEGG